jgi:hypothetical protein
LLKVSRRNGRYITGVVQGSQSNLPLAVDRLLRCVKTARQAVASDDLVLAAERQDARHTPLPTMPRLVHLAPQRLARRIDRSGLRGSPLTISVGGSDTELLSAVYAMPVLPDFSVTYQWLRELRRWKNERLIAVHFSIPTTEFIYTGRYGSDKHGGSAGKMIAAIMKQPIGAELIIPTDVPRRSISAIRNVRQDVGWVETPDTPHKFACVCGACLPSGSAKLRRRVRGAYESGIAAARAATTPTEATTALQGLYLPLERGASWLRPDPLLGLAQHPDQVVRRAALANLCYFRDARVIALLVECLPDPATGETALNSLLSSCGACLTYDHVAAVAPHRLAALVELLQYSRDSHASIVLKRLCQSPYEAVASAAAAALVDDED